MFYPKPVIKQDEEFKISRFPIIYASVNPATGILGFCTGDGGIVLSNISKKDKALQSSSIQMDIEHINKFIWLNNYEFAAVGTGGYIKRFSLMNLCEESFQVHSNGINAIKEHNGLVYTGSSDGSVSSWDPRSKSAIVNIPHTWKTKPQPIKDITVNSNYLYSSTIYMGRLWAWDARMCKKPIKVIETGKCQNQLLYDGGCIYSANSDGIMRASPTLELKENFLEFNERQLNSGCGIEFSARFNSLIFTAKDLLYIKPIDGNSHFYSSIQNGISGIELLGSNRLLSYFRSGTITLSTISLQVDRERSFKY